MKRTTVKLKLDYEGASPETVGWPQMRQFMDAFARAMRAMPGDTDPKSMLPVGVEEGSFVLLVAMPDIARAAVWQLRRGPDKTWTTGMRQATAPLYRFIREIGATVTDITGRKPAAFKLPEDVETWSVRQFEALEGEVFRAGGRDGDVEVRFDFDGLVTCKVGREHAAALGGRLYQRVIIEAETRRSRETLELESVEVLTVKSAHKSVPVADGIAELRRTLGDDFCFDVDELLRERRA